MSTDLVFSDIQKVNPSAIIELFSLALDSNLHGANTTYRFHAGSNLDANGKIVWNGNVSKDRKLQFKKGVYMVESNNDVFKLIVK